MDTTKPVDWNTGQKSGLVGIDSHELWLCVHGPDRKQEEQPLVIIIPGLANNTTSWAAVIRGIAKFARVLQYERLGYGQSQVAPGRKPTASTIARELSLLLEMADLRPPYVIVAHSWGGILSREFLTLLQRPGDEVVGMVFVEANQERTLEVLDWRRLAQSKLLAGVDFYDATGISRDHKLTAEEWRIYQETQNTESHQRQAELEIAEYANSFPDLASKAQLHQRPPFLGDCPTCVIKGNTKAEFENLLEAGLVRGNGDGAEQAVFEAILSTWDEKNTSLQSEILSLSSCTRFIETKRSGHNVQLTEPELVVDSVGWILSKLDSRAGK